jgi:arylsulfatase A-like enzyme
MNQPNVIVFFTDQQRWDLAGVHGNPLELMPNFDRMAMHGTHIAHSFTCQPVCGPARSCLQTGQYATTTGCWRNGIPLSAKARTLAHHFREGGYTTGYIGKWHLGSQDPVPEPERGGYEYWLAANVLEMTSEPYHTVVYDNDNNPVTLPGYRVDALTDAAIRYMAQPRQKPYFLFISYLEPHHQNRTDDYPAPTGYEERYRGRWTPPDLAALGGSSAQHLAGYCGMVKRLDEALGRIRDALKSLGQLDNTIILFTSDHGCHFKTRNAEYKRSCHDSSVRVPTAFSGPGFDGGGRVRQLVSLVDLPPTLLDAAGLPVPSTMQGRSLMPLLRGQPARWTEEVLIQISESQVARAVRTQRWKYCVAAPGKNGNKDSASDRYVEESLYDLANDPYELTNLIDRQSHEEVAAVMRERLLRQLNAAGEPIPIIEPALRKPAGQRWISKEESRQ